MKTLSSIAAAFALSCPAAVIAQPAPPITSLAASPPTTHVLAIGTLTVDRSAPQLKGIMPAEVTATVGLYLSGKIEQWWSQKDKPGIVFLLNATSVEEARATLADLPLDRGGLMHFEFLALGPLKPLQYLTDGQPK